LIDRLAIIGVGLIGSSLSLALKQAASVGHVVGHGRNLHNLEKGIELGVIDSYETSIADCVSDADVVVVAVPLGAMPKVFSELKSNISSDVVVTDVGSSKGSVVAAAKVGLGEMISRFVPGHPIAGNEKSGVEAGFASLYQSRRVILTPLDETAQDGTCWPTHWCTSCRISTITTRYFVTPPAAFAISPASRQAIRSCGATSVCQTPRLWVN
jgi:prephenate dehydrogenase